MSFGGMTQEQARRYKAAKLLVEVGNEMDRQVSKWGVQNHPSYEGLDVFELYFEVDAALAKRICDTRMAGWETDPVSWTDIFLEEVMEALEEARGHNLTALREELIQCAAVALSWVDSIDRNECPECHIENAHKISCGTGHDA
jgi:hypothetical protein